MCKIRAMELYRALSSAAVSLVSGGFELPTPKREIYTDPPTHQRTGRGTARRYYTLVHIYVVAPPTLANLLSVGYFVMGGYNFVM